MATLLTKQPSAVVSFSGGPVNTGSPAIDNYGDGNIDLNLIMNGNGGVMPRRSPLAGHAKYLSMMVPGKDMFASICMVAEALEIDDIALLVFFASIP